MSTLNQYFDKMNEMIALYSQPLGDDLSLDELQEINKKQYEPYLLENYKTSFANPDYCYDTFGEVGPALAVVFGQLLNLKTMTNLNNPLAPSFVEYLKGFETLWREDNLTKDTVEKAIQDYSFTFQNYRVGYTLDRNFNSGFTTLMDVILNEDLSKPDYLYKLNMYVGDNEILMQQHLSKMPQEEIDAIAIQFIDAYMRGYPRNNMDRAGRNGMGIVGVGGMERVTKALILEMQKRGYKPFVVFVQSTEYNKQFDIDHKADQAVYLTEAHLDAYEKQMEEAFSERAEVCKDYSGILYFVRFGEKTFMPTSSKHKYNYSDEQNAINQKTNQAFFKVREQYIPEKHRSFSIMGFPVPEIHEDFEAVFNDFIRINNLDNATYEAIQAKIIDALDKGDYVHVLGRDGNETDIKVQLQPIKDPAKETGFFNCAADVNIPVGEVFTSPKLEGTNGLLHIKDSYINGLNYKDLKIWFKDGYAVDYTCGNFETREEGKKYVQENIFHPHNELPLGEFAIGTNTLAYDVSRKYGIVNKLDVLFVEKMGPHFAVGDTCFSHTEDMEVFNPDGKEIIARDNAHSIRRKEDDPKAYTYVHEDITIPYDDIGIIAAVTAEGEEIAIIKDGRFALSGTEELNEPLDA